MIITFVTFHLRLGIDVIELDFYLSFIIWDPIHPLDFYWI